MADLERTRKANAVYRKTRSSIPPLSEAEVTKFVLDSYRGYQSDKPDIAPPPTTPKQWQARAGQTLPGRRHRSA